MNSREFLIKGKKYTLTYSEKKFLRPNVLLWENDLLVFRAENNPKKHDEVLLDWLKRQSKAHFFKRVQEIAEAYGFEYNRVTIRDQSTRWGSCSSQKNLNFNWRLYLAPVEISDYVIVHELAHTQQMNHSKAFWSIVQAVLPDYKERRKWLRANERMLKELI